MHIGKKEIQAWTQETYEYFLSVYFHKVAAVAITLIIPHLLYC